MAKLNIDFLALEVVALAEQAGDLICQIYKEGAEVFEKKGELDSAKKYYTRVLEIREKNFGPEAPVYAQALNKLGLIYKPTGEVS